MEKTEIRALLKLLNSNREHLSQYQIEFMNGIRKYYSKYNKLSPRQEEVLNSIAATLPEIEIQSRNPEK